MDEITVSVKRNGTEIFFGVVNLSRGDYLYLNQPASNELATVRLQASQPELPI